MSYLNQLPIELCESLSYYIDPLYMVEVFKLECFSTLVANDKFWKNKVKNNFTQYYSDNLPLDYYKKLYVRLAYLQLNDLKLTIMDPKCKKIHNQDLSEFQGLETLAAPLLALNKELDDLKIVYKKLQRKIKEANNIYKTQVESMVNAIVKKSEELKLSYDHDVVPAYKFYEIVVDNDFLNQLASYEKHVDGMCCFDEESDIIHLNQVLNSINEKYGSQSMMKYYGTGEMVNRIMAEHCVAIGLRLTTEDVPNVIYWVDLRAPRIMSTTERRIPYFVHDSLNKSMIDQDLQILYNAPFEFNDEPGHADCSCDSSSSEEDHGPVHKHKSVFK